MKDTEREPPRSPLPTDPGYWDSLAKRILDDARAPLAAYATRREDWHVVISREAPWLLAASAAALMLIWIALPDPASPASRSFMEQAVTPREAAGSLLGSAEPPSVEELMLAFPPAPESEVAP